MKAIHKHKYSWAAQPEVKERFDVLEGGVDVTEQDEYPWRPVISRNAQAVKVLNLERAPSVLVQFKDGSVYRYEMKSLNHAVSVYLDMLQSGNAWSQVGRPRLELDTSVTYSRYSGGELYIS